MSIKHLQAKLPLARLFRRAAGMTLLGGLALEGRLRLPRLLLALIGSVPSSAVKGQMGAEG
jgi:hypothetical protein